jgi:hypothetical protein
MCRYQHNWSQLSSLSFWLLVPDRFRVFLYQTPPAYNQIELPAPGWIPHRDEAIRMEREDWLIAMV